MSRRVWIPGVILTLLVVLVFLQIIINSVAGN